MLTYKIRSLFNKNLSKIHYGIGGSDLPPNYRYLLIYELFDLEYVGKSKKIFETEEAYNIHKKSLIKNLDETQLLKILCAHVPHYDIKVKSFFDFSDYIKKLFENPITCISLIPTIDTREVISTLSNNLAVSVNRNLKIPQLGRSANNYAKIALKGKNKLGKIIFNEKSVFLESYDNIHSIYEGVIDSSLAIEEDSNPLTPSERETLNKIIKEEQKEKYKIQSDYNKLVTEYSELKDKLRNTVDLKNSSLNDIYEFINENISKHGERGDTEMIEACMDLANNIEVNARLALTNVKVNDRKKLEDSFFSYNSKRGTIGVKSPFAG
jgi:hypothetical protein